MPPPSSENDLKRLARRRLIGAVALTLLAVIVLPLLLEDEPPPTSSLSVHMAAAPAPAPEQAAQPEGTDKTDASAAPAPQAPQEPLEPQPAPVEPAKPLAKPAPAHEAAKPSQVERAKPEPVKPEPVKSEPPRPMPKPQPAEHAATPASQAKPAAASEAFVVQLAALSDGAKARELKARAALAGLPAYTDTVGSLTRVRVGPYSTREAAVTAAVKLAEHGMTGQVLAK